VAGIMLLETQDQLALSKPKENLGDKFFS